jgi:hypothetical protein
MPYKSPAKARERNKHYHKKHYDTNRASYVAAVTVRRRELREFVNGLKVGRACADCHKEYPPYVMDFDHRPDTEKVCEVALLAHRGVSRERILEEVAKCDLVCANCHRERTHKRAAPIV